MKRLTEQFTPIECEEFLREAAKLRSAIRGKKPEVIKIAGLTLNQYNASLQGLVKNPVRLGRALQAMRKVYNQVVFDQVKTSQE